MNILIYYNHTKYNQVDDQFMNHLIDMLVSQIRANYSKSAVDKLNKYLDENIFTGKRKYHCYELAEMIIANIHFHKYDFKYEIDIDMQPVIPHYNQYKLYDIMMLIDKGCINCLGTHMFSDAFNSTQKNLQMIYYNYTRGTRNVTKAVRRSSN